MSGRFATMWCVRKFSRTSVRQRIPLDDWKWQGTRKEPGQGRDNLLKIQRPKKITWITFAYQGHLLASLHFPKWYVTPVFQQNQIIAGSTCHPRRETKWSTSRKIADLKCIKHEKRHMGSWAFCSSTSKQYCNPSIFFFCNPAQFQSHRYWMHRKTLLSKQSPKSAFLLGTLPPTTVRIWCLKCPFQRLGRHLFPVLFWMRCSVRITPATFLFLGLRPTTFFFLRRFFHTIGDKYWPHRSPDCRLATASVWKSGSWLLPTSWRLFVPINHTQTHKDC